MRKLIILLLVFGMTSIAIGEVSVRVCRADGNTCFEPDDPYISFKYPDIMVGTELTIIVSSDTGGYWSGSLAITGEDVNYGVLSCRDFNEFTDECEGSRLPPAGTGARVHPWEELGVQGFDLYGHSSAVPGDWFIIDYNALEIGDCNVGFYDHSISGDVPIYHLEFSHVRTRDFNGDTKVDFIDFAVLASYWGETDCIDPNWCEGADLDINGSVDSNDLALFVDYWLEKTR
ncbi:MAG: dockerin type I domain-containing protein [Sedimentisphaerales bacterium]